ncbi:MAG: hypothetical protein U5L76_02305 [Patescibacteria group bacterium]|nr:hypothetical protein [Patescibacteria group bacterium]
MKLNQKSEVRCGNCEENFEINDDGQPIQQCPHCDSQEMVKNFKKKEGEK